MLSGLEGKVAESLPGESIAVRVDVSVEEDVQRYLDEAANSFGRIDLHHLNAGIPGSAGGFPDLTAEEFDRVMAVNVRGVFLGLLRGATMYGGPLGIRVNAVAPGIVPTALFSPSDRAGAWNFGSLDERTYRQAD